MSVGNFLILALVSTTSATTMPVPRGIHSNEVRVGSHWPPIECHTEQQFPSPSRHGVIPYGIFSFFAHF